MNRMRLFLYAAALSGVLLPACGSSSLSVENYENSEYKVELKRRSDNIITDFTILNKKTNSRLSYTPELILDDYDGTVPEGTPRVDFNFPDWSKVYQSDSTSYSLYTEMAYQCDSTYSVDTDSISISFALEVKTHKRMDLSISRSRLKAFPDAHCTLVKQSE